MAATARGVQWGRDGGALRALATGRGPLLYLATLAVLTLAGWAFPLTDHLGYELSESIALAAGLFGAAIGVSASRKARDAGGMAASARHLGAAIFLSQAWLLVPIALALLDGVRRPVCDPLAGLSIYAVLASPSAVLSCCVGFLCAQLAPRRAGWLIMSVFLISLGSSLWPIWKGPQVFAFHQFGGMYPGPIYDAAVSISPALLWFRGATLLYAVAAAALSITLAPGETSRDTTPRAAAFVLFAVTLTPAILISRRAEEFHFRSSLEQLDEALGARIETPHLILHVPREKSELERKLLARDAEASVAEVLEFLGVEKSNPARIDVFLYRSAEEKRRLIGAADTSFTKPWLRQIHTNDAPAPHPILRHELAHALAADYAPFVFGVPGRWSGLIPDMAFIEGLAVAADWPVGETTVDEEAAALKKLGRLPDLANLFSPGRFYAEAGPNAYTAAGSFIRFLWRTDGADELRAAYGSNLGINKLGDLDGLIRKYLAYLDTVVVAPNQLALASLRFSAPSITRKRCAHEVADLEQKASQAAADGDPKRAAVLWTRCTALEPDDPNLLLQERRSLLAAGAVKEARAIEVEVLAHPKLSEPQRAQLLTESGDAAWRADDAATALQRYAEAAALPQSEGALRSLAARQYALADQARWPAARRLFINNDAGAETWLLLRDLDLARPNEGFAAYLITKQAQNARAWESCERFAGAALGRPLPSPLFNLEALKMRGLCGWRTGDDPAARRAFLQLEKEGSEPRRLEAERLLRRTP
jgi:hypothetical protein